jgi:hypothetical protein
MQSPIKTQKQPSVFTMQQVNNNSQYRTSGGFESATTNQETEEPFAPHCTKNPINVFPEKELRGLSPILTFCFSKQFYIFPGLVQRFGCSKRDKQILEYINLTDIQV